MNQRIFSFLLAILLISSGNIAFSAADDELKFTDVKKQTIEFIGYYKSIQLTPQQENIKTEALKVLPASCCKEFSQATCCCVCNLSRSIWGLSKYLIARKNYSPAQVRAAAEKWIEFTHPNGHDGNSCPAQRCGQSFQKDGCGGMGEQIVFE
jgi:hypothetical protein